MYVMAKRAKKSKPLPRWRVGLIKSTPQRFLGYVDAADEKSARAAAAKEYKISDTLLGRIVVQREE